ncbi:hypothetical protein COLO4_28793 [Corchorus olitorius]|uniref:Uncharacterized protein n=1 Tax=Corchorus olitorius TaxID=93759 RepID=A0A1R3HIE1_9ROSI|nr:hypothetical protein COLO4_28793 [Corchorus olitorius]
MFSPSLKADSPTTKSKFGRDISHTVSVGGNSDGNQRSPFTGEGSFRMRANFALSRFRRLRLEGGSDRREGRQPLPATSSVGANESYVQGSNQRFMNHVDSLILRGRRVARELAAGDSSCEILSGFIGDDGVAGVNAKRGEAGFDCDGHIQQNPVLIAKEVERNFHQRYLRKEVEGNCSQKNDATIREFVSESGEILLGNVELLGAAGYGLSIPGIGPSMGQPGLLNGAVGLGLHNGNLNVASATVDSGPKVDQPKSDLLAVGCKQGMGLSKEMVAGYPTLGKANDVDVGLNNGVSVGQKEEGL